MKRAILLIVVSLHAIVANGQEINSTDSLLRTINGNIEKIKEEIVKEKPTPYSGQSIFEDREGNSAIFLPNGGTIRLNTADASIKLSFANRVSDRKSFYGFDISGKTNDGLLSLISEANISPGVKVNGIIGFQELFSKSDLLDAWVALKIGYLGSSFKLFRADSVFANQIEKTSFDTFISSVAFNLKIGGNKLLALSAGYNKATNYESLQEIELVDEKTIIDPLSNTTRTYETKVKVRSGEHKISNQIPINLDYFWTPDNNPRIGFYHYWRTKFSSEKSTHGIGNGLFLLKKNNPLSAVAGIILETKDISKLEDGFGENFIINLVVAYNFEF